MKSGFKAKATEFQIPDDGCPDDGYVEPGRDWSELAAVIGSDRPDSELNLESGLHVSLRAHRSRIQGQGA